MPAWLAAVTQFLPLPKVWNGLAFSKDGHRIFVSGGESGMIHVFNYADGKATPADPVKPAPDAAATVLGSIAVHPTTGRLYVCNEGNHEVWVLNPDTLALETRIAAGQHPHSCVMGADNRHLYVSNWGSRSISLIDTETHRRVRDFTVGLRPNDLALRRIRLFVACGATTRSMSFRPGRGGKGCCQSRAPALGQNARDHLTSLYPQSPEGNARRGPVPDGRTFSSPMLITTA
jgi:YVTN family beta-propeller protein